METQQLLNERGKEYGETHYLVGVIIGVLRDPFINMVADHPELVHNYVLMLSKVVRMVFSPTKLDNYDDLIGYATLSKGILERKNKDG